MSLHQQRLSFTLALLLLVLSACNLPRNSTPTESGSGLIYTAAAETVNAQLTLANRPPGTPFSAATFTPPGFLPSATPPSSTAIPAVTTLAPSATPIACDRARFVKDVNFPDNTFPDHLNSF